MMVSRTPRTELAGSKRSDRVSISIVMAVLALVCCSCRVDAQTEAVEYYGTDVIGSVRIVFAPDGGVLAAQHFRPFGEPLLAGAGEHTEGLGARDMDAELQQMHFGTRQFQVRSGRFTSIDRFFDGVFDPQKWNRYTYARNNPINFSDYSGDDPIYGSSVPGCDTFNCDIDLWWWYFGNAPVVGGVALWNVSDPVTSEGPAGPPQPPPASPQGPPPQGPQTPQPPPQPRPSTKDVVQCYGKGFLTAAAGAVGIGLVAAGASAVGVPAAIVTAGLGVVAVLGGVPAVIKTIQDVNTGNHAAIAYDIGAFSGGAVAGYLGGPSLATAINGAPSQSGWSLGRDWANRYQPSFPGGSWQKWFGSGPDGASAGGSMAFTGSGAARVAHGGC